MLRKTKVENGAVQGMAGADPRITVYKGIPFAAPPVGELRWRAPQAAANWEGELKAFDFGPIAMQRIPGLDRNDVYAREFYVDSDLPMSEDCLYLNVWTPAGSDYSSSEKLPVFIWYHGGALQLGYTSEMEFNGERLARRGIVVVTAAYRVNSFGFLTHPELKAENPDQSANFGHLDQKFAAEWVKKNIAAFGGDPNNITIGGQSAGGSSTLTLLTSPLTKGLFHKAIVLSGNMVFSAYQDRMRSSSLQDAEKQGEEFFDYLGVKNLKEARALSAEFIRDKTASFERWWSTVVDGKLVVDNVKTRLLKNEHHHIPLMMGYTSNEFKVKPDVKSYVELEAFAKEKFGEKAKDFLDALGTKDIYHALVAAEHCAIELGIRTVYKNIAKVENHPDSYMYMFDAPIPGKDNPGAFHSSDLWFFFETLALSWRPFTGAHYDLARHMCNYWANFMKSGNPNGMDQDGCTPLPQWKAYSEGGKAMLFKDKAAMDSSAPDKLMEFLVDMQVRFT